MMPRMPLVRHSVRGLGFKLGVIHLDKKSLRGSREKESECFSCGLQKLVRKECERVSNAFHMQLQQKTVSRLLAS